MTEDAAVPSGVIEASDGVVSSGSFEDLEQELKLRVANVGGRLSPNDEQVLRFLDEHLEELAFHTSESIAQGSGVSRAAVVRFARRLGYGGFAELRGRGRRALRSRDNARDQSSRPRRSMLERKAERDAENVALLPEMLEQTLPDAARTIARAERLWVLASRETHGLAVYVHHLIHHVRSDVHLVDLGFPDALRDATSGDAVLACTFRPYARQTIDLLAHARRSGVRVVVVTDGHGHPFVREDDIVLAVPVGSPTMFLSFAAAVSALEALAAHVAHVDADRTHRTLSATDRFVAAHRLMAQGGPTTGQRDTPDSASG